MLLVYKFTVPPIPNVCIMVFIKASFLQTDYINFQEFNFICFHKTETLLELGVGERGSFLTFITIITRTIYKTAKIPKLNQTTWIWQFLAYFSPCLQVFCVESLSFYCEYSKIIFFDKILWISPYARSQNAKR